MLKRCGSKLLVDITMSDVASETDAFFRTKQVESLFDALRCPLTKVWGKFIFWQCSLGILVESNAEEELDCFAGLYG